MTLLSRTAVLELCEELESLGIWTATKQLGEHDTAQREALARVEAERDQWKESYVRNAATLSKSWAQLAEAVAVIGNIARTLEGQKDFRSMRQAKSLRTFLARHTQAEQQEARNAEVARESLRPENQRIEPVEPLRVPHPLEAQSAQASEFQREDRYMVIKRKDLDLLSPTDRDLALTLMGELSAIMETWNVPKREYLVVEGDWPEYEPAWAAIQARVTGRGAQCCKPTAEELASLQAGDCTPEELWGGSKPTCPKCIDRAALATQPAAGEPVSMQARMHGCRWENYHEDDFAELVAAGMEIRWLYTAPPAAAPVVAGERVALSADDLEIFKLGPAYDEFPGKDCWNNAITKVQCHLRERDVRLVAAPPAAAHGDEAVPNLVPGLQWAIDYCNAMLRQGNDRMLVEVIRTRLENVLGNQPAAMRAQAGDHD